MAWGRRWVSVLVQLAPMEIMAAPLGNVAGRPAMVARDGARDTEEALTSDVDAVPPAVRLCMRPATPIVVDAAIGRSLLGGIFWIAVVRMTLATCPLRPAGSDPIARTSLGTDTSLTSTSLLAALT